MFKNIVRLEFTVVDKVYHFMCDTDSPIEHIKEALFQCQKYIGQVEDNIKTQMAAQAAQATPPPVVPEAASVVAEEPKPE